MWTVVIKLLKLVKTPLKEGFPYTEMVNSLFSRHILTSTNKTVLVCSCLKVNLIFECFVFIYSTNFFKFSWELKVTKISSTYLLQMLGIKFLWAIRKPMFPKWQRNALAKVGPNGDPMATPSNWQWYSLSNVKSDSRKQIWEVL